jgi:hypothetical protein
VAAARRVRGTLERTYELRAAAANRGVAERLPAMSVAEQRHAFMAFVAGLLGDFDRYLARGDVDPLRDGVSYRLTGLWLDDAELAALLGDIITLFEPYLANGPTSGRTRRIVAAVLLPGDEARAPVRIASASIGLGDVERPTTHRPLQRRTTSSLSSRAALSASPRPVQRSVRGGGDACSPGSVAHLIHGRDIKKITMSERSPRQRLSDAIRAHLRHSDRFYPESKAWNPLRPDVDAVIAEDDKGAKLASDIASCFRQILEDGMATGEFACIGEPRIVAYAVLGMCNWMPRWYRKGGRLSVDEISETFVRLVEAGLIPATADESPPATARQRR